MTLCIEQYNNFVNLNSDYRSPNQNETQKNTLLYYQDNRQRNEYVTQAVTSWFVKCAKQIDDYNNHCIKIHILIVVIFRWRSWYRATKSQREPRRATASYKEPHFVAFHKWEKLTSPNISLPMILRTWIEGCPYVAVVFYQSWHVLDSYIIGIWTNGFTSSIC